jgi:hypothetical protein
VITKGKILRVPRINVDIEGGIGNQLFTYFAGYALAKRFGATLSIEKSKIYTHRTVHRGCIDELNLEGKFTRRKYLSPKVVRLLSRVEGFSSRKCKFYPKIRVLICHKYQSPTIGYDSNLFKLKPPIRISGYYQSYRYFSGLSTEEKSRIFPKTPSEWFFENLDKFKKEGYLAIHLRRGDYKELSETFGLLGENYYMQGLMNLRERFPMNPIIVFTDSINDAKTTLKNLENQFKIEYLQEPIGTSPCEVLVLMSVCKGIVIANSTFSYWAALIADDTTAIIAPSKWFKSLDDPGDLIPPSWTKIDSNWE